ncbi:MAG: hypothetical protein JXJ04_07290 [Spirochaetales bacterium]|nr:hypothetical protein [Spirochaetales bacterium]
MGKVSKQARERFIENSKEYKKEIIVLKEKERKILITIKKGDLTFNMQRIKLAEDNLIMVSFYVVLNSLSVTMLGVKNESYLNEARKCLYKCIIYLEETVTNAIDVPFSQYEENLVSIKDFDDIGRYNLLRKLGYSIQTVEDAFGANSKWKWSFVELLGRYATISKNLLDLKMMIKKLDPRVEGYPERNSWLELVKQLLQKAADKYRGKYELSTQRIDDMKLAINYLKALKRLYITLSETQNLEIIKKKIDVWNTKMEADIKKKDEEKKHRSYR